MWILVTIHSLTWQFPLGGDGEEQNRGALRYSCLPIHDIIMYGTKLLLFTNRDIDKENISCFHLQPLFLYKQLTSKDLGTSPGSTRKSYIKMTHCATCILICTLILGVGSSWRGWRGCTEVCRPGKSFQCENVLSTKLSLEPFFPLFFCFLLGMPMIWENTEGIFINFLNEHSKRFMFFFPRVHAILIADYIYQLWFW